MATNGFAAVPLFYRYVPWAARARQLLADARFGPVSHIYTRQNRPGSARYPAWDAPWMLDPAVAGGGCLRNLSPHGLDLFMWLTGEEVEVTGAQLSWRARPARRGLRVGTAALGQRHPGDSGGRQHVSAGRHRR